MNLEDAEKVATLDELVNSTQELTDVFVKFLESEASPAAGPEDIRAADAVVNSLLCAFAKMYFASRCAIDAVATEIVGATATDLVIDF